MTAMNLLLVVTAFVASTALVVKADDSKPACDALIQCLSDAIIDRQACDAITATINGKWPPKYNEHQQSVQDKYAKINELNKAKRDKKIECLQASSNTTIVSCNQTRKEQCADFVTTYKPRPKRQAANVTKPNNATAVAAAKAQALAEEKAKKAEAAKEAAAKKEADKQERAKLQSDLKECQTALAAREAKCSQLAGCCSENTICDWKYQTDPDFAQLATLQIALQYENRATTCPSPPALVPPPVAAAAAAASPPPTPAASSPPPSATASPPPVTPGAAAQV